MAFKIGQKIVYPNHGVTVVEKIEPGKIAGEEQTYYFLRLLSNDSDPVVMGGVSSRGRFRAVMASESGRNPIG